MDNNNNGFHINTDFDGEDIKSSSSNDIKSNSDAFSEKKDTGFIGMSDYLDNSEPKALEPKRKKRSFAQWWKSLTGGKKALLITVASLVVVLCGLIVWIWPLLFYNYNEITSKPEELGFEEVIDEKIINIALFGLDTRNEKSFKGNSDSIMILSLNTKTKKVKVISLMRDTLVPIEKNGKMTYGKLNSAYGSGGPELAIKTINQMLDLDITEYATINFYGMVDIIDAVGGIDITVTEDELKWKGTDHPNLNNCMEEICVKLNKNINEYLIKAPGDYHVNGIQAVAYSRVRNCRNVWGTNNDYGRTDRQRHVMQQLFSKAITLNKSEYVTLAKALVPCSETSLSTNEILNLAFNILLEHPTFEQYRIPQENFLMNGPTGYGSIVYFDIDYATRAIHSIIYDEMTLDDFIAANPIEKNDWYKERVGNSGTKPSGGNTSSTTSSTEEKPSDTTSGESSEGTDSSETDSSSKTEGTGSEGTGSGGEDKTETEVVD